MASALVTPLSTFSLASTTRLFGRAAIVAALAVGSGCGARTADLGNVVPNAEQTAVSGTQIRQRLRLVFSWTLQDRDARFSGDGAMRIEQPYHARLDLFGPRGEGYLSAALVDSELRLPATALPNLLPPPTMLWAVMGVFRPPHGADLVGAKGDSASVVMQYRLGAESWKFQLRNGQLVSAEWLGPDQGKQTVEIREYHLRGLPARAVYRDWRAFRELTLTLTEVHEVESPFPPETWLPGVR